MQAVGEECIQLGDNLCKNGLNEENDQNTDGRARKDYKRGVKCWKVKH
jgi:hypothetical protein